jgi:hypothetical protein
VLRPEAGNAKQLKLSELVRSTIVKILNSCSSVNLRVLSCLSLLHIMHDLCLCNRVLSGEASVKAHDMNTEIDRS